MLILPYEVWGAVVATHRYAYDGGAPDYGGIILVAFFGTIAITIGPAILGAVVGGVSGWIYGTGARRGVSIGIVSGIVGTALAWGVIAIRTILILFDIGQDSDVLFYLSFALIFAFSGASVVAPLGIVWWRWSFSAQS